MSYRMLLSGTFHSIQAMNYNISFKVVLRMRIANLANFNVLFP